MKLSENISSTRDVFALSKIILQSFLHGFTKINRLLSPLVAYKKIQF